VSVVNDEVRRLR